MNACCLNSDGSLSYRGTLLASATGGRVVERSSQLTFGTLCPMAYDLEIMLVRVMGWNDDLNAGFATTREMKVMTSSGRR
jgi:hypothetical protein